jgi:hypothetical protein
VRVSRGFSDPDGNTLSLTEFERPTSKKTTRDAAMKFARIVFVIAGVWGIVVVTPLYFLHDVTGQPYAAPTLYPHFFYGFLSVTMAWQIAFLVIGSNPVRFRPLMIPTSSRRPGT